MLSLTTVMSVVGVLGIGGTIAAIIFFPTVVIPLLQAVVARLIACKPCLYAIATIAACLASYWGGRHQAVKACRAEQLQAELRNKQIDLDIAREAAKEAESARAEIADQAIESENKVKEYAEALKKRPNAACVLGPDDFASGLRKRSGAK